MTDVRSARSGGSAVCAAGVEGAGYQGLCGPVGRLRPAGFAVLAVVASLGLTACGASRQSAERPVTQAPASAPSFFAQIPSLDADSFVVTGRPDVAYRVTSAGRIERFDEAESTVLMPSVGSVLGLGEQTSDHGWSIAAVRVSADTTSAKIMVHEGRMLRAVNALRGVKDERGQGYAVFATERAFEPKDVHAVTILTPRGAKTSTR